MSPLAFGPSATNTSVNKARPVEIFHSCVFRRIFFEGDLFNRCWLLFENLFDKLKGRSSATLQDLEAAGEIDDPHQLFW